MNFKSFSGEREPAIIKYTHEYTFDLGIIGSRGLHTLQETTLSSVSPKAAKEANYPVMIVK